MSKKSILLLIIIILSFVSIKSSMFNDKGKGEIVWGKIYQDKPSIGISIPYDNLTVEQKEILEKTNII